MTVRAIASALCAIVVFGVSPASAQTAPATISTEDKAGIDAAMMSMVAKCWSPPPVRSLPMPRIVVGFELTREGALAGPPAMIESKSEAPDPAHVAAAIRAVRKCAPYALPARFFNHWRLVQINFALTTPAPASPSPQ